MRLRPLHAFVGARRTSRGGDAARRANSVAAFPSSVHSLGDVDSDLTAAYVIDHSDAVLIQINKC